MAALMGLVAFWGHVLPLQQRNKAPIYIRLDYADSTVVIDNLILPSDLINIFDKPINFESIFCVKSLTAISAGLNNLVKLIAQTWKQSYAEGSARTTADQK